MEYWKSTMENLALNSQFWCNRNVFVTGHTGFKGGWLSFWLSKMGANVYGYALNPPTNPSFYVETNLKYRLINSTIGDIRDLDLLVKAMKTAKPSIIIHLAAQPLVLDSYKFPVETFGTNVMGTVNVLESARYVDSLEAIVVVTTDKCYENREWQWPYRENDRLGGHDTYSSSKACAELVTSAYRDSFIASSGIQLASARAGNVIGGGDWANDRLIPDFFRAVDSGKKMIVRSPNAVRPWQHVMEPIFGYLLLAQKLVTNGSSYAEAWNFGPNESDARTVSWVVDQISQSFPSLRCEVDITKQEHETSLLRLDSSKAKSKLDWSPRWSLNTALEKTIEWHQAWQEGIDLVKTTNSQITSYENFINEKKF
jgi:CDP-glucose 4,6-dehydratase